MRIFGFQWSRLELNIIKRDCAELEILNVTEGGEIGDCKDCVKKFNIKDSRYELLCFKMAVFFFLAT